MHSFNKPSRNNACPCGSGTKYKKCCYGKVNWGRIFQERGDWKSHLSVRGRNIHFINRLTEILEIDHKIAGNIEEYKKKFTGKAVREIHEALMEIWPPDSDLFSLLSRLDADVSGLYIGDYDITYISRGIVRHSIYANKILVVDPFIYPLSVRDDYNPILNPTQHRAQTLKNVNFWFALLPWIKADIVNVIRIPTDFDPVLARDSIFRQRMKIGGNPDLEAAANASVESQLKRGSSEQTARRMFLAMPDGLIRQNFLKHELHRAGVSVEEFLAYIRSERLRDPEFLETLDEGEGNSQLHVYSTGASYDIAQLVAGITKSYLVTDIYLKWKEIELDRGSHNAENGLWSPFAKALQEAPLKYLDGVRLEHALRLRSEGRLESLRAFLLRVWKSARTDSPFEVANPRLLAEELRHEVRNAEQEWRKIDDDLIKLVGAELAAGILAAGPLIASGHALFVAAAAVSAGVSTLGASLLRRKGFPDVFPAAFFMKLDNEE